MTKKQVFGVSLVTALPAAFLLYVLIMAAINHGSGVFAGLMWLFWGLALLTGAFLAAFPLLVQLFYPAEGFAPAAAAAPALGPVQDADLSEIDEDEDELADDDGLEDGDEIVDDGEQLFEEDALDDDYDDFEGGFDDEENK